MTDPKRMIWRRTPSGFVPDNEDAEKFMARSHVGDYVELKGSIPRSLKHHRFYWALINLVFENQEYFKTAYKFHTAIKLAIGHTETIKTKDREWEIPLPTDFCSMDEITFTTYINRVMDFLVVTFSAAADKDLLLAEVCEMTGIPASSVMK